MVFHDILGRSGDADRPCTLGDHPRSYGDLRRAVEEVAAALRRAGCDRGSRVAVCLDQGFEYLVAMLAVRAVDGIVVLMAPDWTEREKARVLAHSECRFGLADVPHLAGPEPEASSALPGVDVLLLRLPVRETEEPSPGDAVIIYTSGTTGQPKGVVLTDEGVSANVAAVARYLELGARDIAPVFTPTCYAYSLSQNLTHLWVGGSVLPLPSGLMFPQELMRAISQHRATGISGTPTAFRILSELDTEPDLDLSSVRYVMTGGQFLDARLVARIRGSFPRARVVNMYGASENSPRIAFQYVEGGDGMDPRGYFAVGHAVEGTRIRVVTDGNADAARGEVGEVIVAGTSRMRGYWRDPDATSERLVDGWFHTRDLGYLDEGGRLHLTGRRSTIINIGNEKVSPEEVEKVLLELPGISDAAVFGVADPMLGESVHALIVLPEDSGLQLADVQRHCRERVSGYKVPRRIHVVAEIPRTLYGKIDRSGLRVPEVHS